MRKILTFGTVAAALLLAAAVLVATRPAVAHDLMIAQAGTGGTGTPGTIAPPPSPGSPASPSHDTLNPSPGAPSGSTMPPGTIPPGSSSLGSPSTGNPSTLSPTPSPMGAPSNTDRLLVCDSMSDPGARRLCEERVQTQ